MMNKVEILERFSRHGLSPAEHAVLQQTGFTPRPLRDVARHSAVPDYCLGIAVSLAECEAAVASCLEKGWLFQVTELWLQGTTSRLESERIIGPICGLPSVGEVDISESGIEILQRFQDDERGKRSFDPAALADHLARHPFVILDILDSNDVSRRERGYSYMRPDPEQVLSGYREMGEIVLYASGPIPISRLCITWRDDPSNGYFMDVEIANPR